MTASQQRISVRNHVIHFFCDFRFTGQFTINSFVLHMIDMMPEVLTQGIYFTPGISMGPAPIHFVSFDEYFGPVLWESSL